MIQLSPHFTLTELIESDTAQRLGINNVPTDDEVLDNLHTLAAGLERVRAALDDAPILISSGYRSPRLNAAIKGSKNSAHCLGLAADFRAPAFGSPIEISRELAARAGFVGFDQLIFEGTWVHVAFPPADQDPREEVLTAHFGPGGAMYTRGVV